MRSSFLDNFRFKEFCAIYIQNWWMKHRERVEKTKESPQEQIRIYGSVPASNQAAPTKVPGPPIPQQVSRPRRPLTERTAATVIQRAWRKHIVRKIFSYVLSITKNLTLFSVN